MNKYIEINKSVLKENVKEIIKHNQYQYYIGIVKADAYGHGYGIVNTLIEAGINYLAVASLDEALKVRGENSDIPILILNPINLNDINVAIKNNFTLTISNKEDFEKLIHLNSKNIKVHIKLDTGLNRLGFNTKEDFEYVNNKINEENNIILEGLYTHLSSSLYPDEFYNIQINKFEELTKSIDLNDIPIIHIFKSNTTYYLDSLPFCNAVRLGVLMYGVLPDTTNIPHQIKEEFDKRFININTSFKLISKVIEVKKVYKGDFIGYNKSYELKEDSVIGIVPIGYSDGIPMTNDKNYVVINDNKYKIIGSINMNVMTVLIDDSVKINDKVTIVDNNSIYDYIKHNKIRAQIVFGALDSNLPKIYIN